MTGSFRALPVETKYWKPSDDWLQAITESVKGKLVDGDAVVVSEKAISTASNNIIDEAKIKPSITARIIARFWMRIAWGYLFGTLCHLHAKTITRLRAYPLIEGSRHKQVALSQAGFLQALMFGSEGGIDGSNLAYSYVSLPLNNAGEIAERIRSLLFAALGKRVVVMIVDTDKTYSFRNFHFAPRRTAVMGIYGFGGFLSYVAGRTFKLGKRSTPVAMAGCRLSAEVALEIAEIANRARGFGAGRTVWDMADKFGSALASVSWEMLETVKHKPIVIIRSKKRGSHHGVFG